MDLFIHYRTSKLSVNTAKPATNPNNRIFQPYIDILDQLSNTIDPAHI